MCTVAPFAFLAGPFFGGGGGVALQQSTTMAACVEAPRPAPNGFADMEVLLRGIRRAQLLAADSEDDDAPTTPVAVLKAPFSYGDDIHSSFINLNDDTKTTGHHDAAPKKKKEDPSWTYDANIDATFREMETDPEERPSWDDNDYLSTTAQMERAELVDWMHAFARVHGLAPGTLHRAVSYLDRFLSSRNLVGGDDRRRYILGGAAVFADDVAQEVGGGCAWRDVVGAERELVAALGYRLGRPTAHTFVDHFTRRDDGGEGGAVRSLAHHLADVALLDRRCARFLPSAVAAAAILLARRVVLVGHDCAAAWSEELVETTGYATDNLSDVVDAIYEMHEPGKEDWPGCALMMAVFADAYTLPPR